MALESVDRLSILRCERVLVDSNDRDTLRSPSPFDVLVPLESGYDRMVAMELVSWNLPLDMAATIYPDMGTDLRTNRFLDVRLVSASPAATLEYTCELELAGYRTAAEFGDVVRESLDVAMDAQAHATFSTANGYAWESTEEGGKLSFQVLKSGVPGLVTAEFLFGSGPSHGFSPFAALGFPREEDTYLSAPITGPVATLPAQLSPFRFVDVTAVGVNGGYKVARVPLTGEDYIARRHRRPRFRLFTRPNSSFSELALRLTLAGGRRPVTVSTNGFDLAFDALLLSPEARVPSWVRQVLLF